ncbi:MAG: hypothetical protein D6701_04085, partial [Gemmatimonadetes bacterium]
MPLHRSRALPRSALLSLLALALPGPATAQEQHPLALQVTIRRTTYGVPHIRGENLKAAYFGLAYAQSEDYGERVAHGLLRARGHLSRYYGPDSVRVDAWFLRSFRMARDAFPRLDPDVRDVYEGFAKGVNHYINFHRDEFPEWMPANFTGVDVLAREIGRPSPRAMNRFAELLRQGRMRRVDERGEGRSGARGAEAPHPPRSAGTSALRISLPPAEIEPARHTEDGSNAWAFAPERTLSGHAILLRNPHLSWTAGYYEAQLTVPGVVDFYGDFRVGGPFSIIGGFNARLGWSTTNNAPDLDEVYALEEDPEQPGNYLFNRRSFPLEALVERIHTDRRENGAQVADTLWSTPLGPVIHRADGWIYVLKSVGDGEFRLGQQFLRMMQAGSLEEWKEAMRIGAKATSNFTYADADGHIYYVWNGLVPVLPHRPGGDSLAFSARTLRDVWRRPVTFDDLPQLLDPPGGYVHNENDPFHYANLNAVFDPADFPANFPPPRLRLRSQLALRLIHETPPLSLEDVIALKHSMRMLLADRMKDELVAEARARASDDPRVAEAADVLERWDNTAARGSRGGVLFVTWTQAYAQRLRGRPLYREPWSAEAPMDTPTGLADPAAAVAALGDAARMVAARYGRLDPAWGAVHRVRRGPVDAPVGGCQSQLGCFRALRWAEQPDGALAVEGGDGWVLAVEFGERPRAYSILAYGQSDRPESPWYAAQAELFADNGMK